MPPRDASDHTGSIPTPPGHVPCRRGTNWRPTSATLRAVRGLGLGPHFRDPNGYIVELTASTGVHQEMMDPALSKPHDALARWQAAKAS